MVSLGNFTQDATDMC